MELAGCFFLAPINYLASYDIGFSLLCSRLVAGTIGNVAFEFEKSAILRHTLTRKTILSLLMASIAALFVFPGLDHHASSVLAANEPVVLKPRNAQEAEAQHIAVEGQELLKANKPFRARPLLEQAVSMWSEPHLHFTLAICYTEIGEFNKAISEYQAAVQLDPHMYDCYNNIASCYQLQGNQEEAIKWFRTYIHRAPKGPEADRVKGMIGALEKAESKQVLSDPNSSDYLQSIMPQGKLERWQRPRIPLKVFISNGTDEQGNPVVGFRNYYNMMVLEALDTWVRASENKLAYVLVPTASTADIICSWTNRRDFLAQQGNSAEQGVARVASRPLRNGNENEIVQVRVIILIVDPTGQKNISDEDMKKTCLHELGHALGFSGHSTNNKDVMFYSESPTVWASLTKRDKATMARLYYDYAQMAQAPQHDTTYGAMPYAQSVSPSYGQPAGMQPNIGTNVNPGWGQPSYQPYGGFPQQQNLYGQPSYQQPYQQPYQQMPPGQYPQTMPPYGQPQQPIYYQQQPPPMGQAQQPAYVPPGPPQYGQAPYPNYQMQQP